MQILMEGIRSLNQGLKDLTALRIRFVGNSEERIKEDFLRIVRFSIYGIFKSVKNLQKDLKIAEELSHNLNQISKKKGYGESYKDHFIPISNKYH